MLVARLRHYNRCERSLPEMPSAPVTTSGSLKVARACTIRLQVHDVSLSSAGRQTHIFNILLFVDAVDYLLPP